jgi:hypothetical protein
MEERKTDPLSMELVVSQKFYDPQDKYLYDEKDPSVYTIKEVAEYLTAKVYEARVAFTNVGEARPTSSSSPRSLKAPCPSTASSSSRSKTCRSPR